MGENVNGVYIPSNEDLLLHYGKKGMKWKRKDGSAGSLGALDEVVDSQDRDLEDKEENEYDEVDDRLVGATKAKTKSETNRLRDLARIALNKAEEYRKKRKELAKTSKD
nr:MAG TPA: hypothetical protein [Caudoviricetes sp.]